MTLWFVFALMTVAAIFAVLWPLSRGSCGAGRRQRGCGLQGSACRDRSRCRRRSDRRVRSRGRAGRNRPPPAGRRGRRARPAGAVEPQPAPRFRDRGAGGVADRGGDVLPRARIAAARRFSAGLAHPHRGCQPAARQSWWRRSRRIWKKIRPTAAAGPCWRRCWRGSAATMTRSGPTAIRSPMPATAPSAAPISAKPLRGAAGGVVTAEAKAEFERAVAQNADEPKASYFLGLAAEQDGRAGRRRRDLARHARQGAGRCAMAAAGRGRAGAGRRSRRTGAFQRCDGRAPRT